MGIPLFKTRQAVIPTVPDSQQPSEDAEEKSLAGHQGSESPDQGWGVTHVSKNEFFSGPLPEPWVIQDYEKIQPGAASRIIRMAERQQDQSHKEVMIVIHCPGSP